MLNKIIIQGRLTKDPEAKTTASGNVLCNFSIACERSFKNEQGKAETDFLNCVAWRGKATLVSQYFHKGDMILITGALQTRSYDDNNGRKVYVTEILVEDVNFCGYNNSKPNQAANSNQAASQIETPFDAAEIDMPFEV